VSPFAAKPTRHDIALFNFKSHQRKIKREKEIKIYKRTQNCIFLEIKKTFPFFLFDQCVCSFCQHTVGLPTLSLPASLYLG
jgi:hypothetical protein